MEVEEGRMTVLETAVTPAHLRAVAQIVVIHQAGRKASLLKNVLNKSVEIINFIKFQTLNTNLFNILCYQIGSMHKPLLHTEQRAMGIPSCPELQLSCKLND